MFEKTRSCRYTLSEICLDENGQIRFIHDGIVAQFILKSCNFEGDYSVNYDLANGCARMLTGKVIDLIYRAKRSGWPDYHVSPRQFKEDLNRTHLFVKDVRVSIRFS